MAGTSNFAGTTFGIPTQGLMTERKKICARWRKDQKIFQTCDVQISSNPSGCVVVSGRVKDPLRSNLLSMGSQVYVQFWAAAPPMYQQSFSGSGLPYPNPEQAYQGSPNVGKVPLGKNGSFQFNLMFPNSYYRQLGRVYVKPHVKLLFRDSGGNIIGKIVSIVLGEGIPYRSLTWPRKRKWSRGPIFFCGRENLPIRPQYKILLDSVYPSVNREYSNFWGLKPPNPEG